MAEDVVVSVIFRLGELLMQEGKYIPGLRGRIEVIQMKLRQLQAILEIADSRQEEDEGIRKWIAETREVAYDTEDFLLKAVSLKKEGSGLRKFTHMFRESTSTHYRDPNIQVIEDKISALESDLRVRNIKRHQGSPNIVLERRQQQRRTYSHHFDEDFVGLYEEVDQLVTEVMEMGDKASQVVSITGMGGIGKTTMAKKIYHHETVRSHFHAFAWACVSQQWQPEDILQRILNKLEPEKKKEISKLKVDELVEELYKIQKTKRCLIVLDDVWGIDVWYSLKHAFLPTREVRSKILLTTRKREIASYIQIDARCYLYEQRHLNEKESWELLKKKVNLGVNTAGISLDEIEGGDGFAEPEYSSDEDAASSTASFQSCQSDVEEDNIRSQDQRNQMDMERLGKEMVGQCGGLPLAIIVLGGLLMTKSTVSEWRTVHQNFNSYLRRGRYSRESGRVHEVLALSYHDLPYHLKPCFLYLGNFPEDFKIPTRKLYQLWAAEGFIPQESYQAEEEESVMERAERYLGELAQRCMIQVRAEEATGKFKYCQLHDLTRELCIVKGKDENFLKKIPLRYEPELTGSPSSAMVTSINVTRRLSIAVDYDFESYFPPKRENLEHIRSALFFSRLSNRRNLQATLEFLCDEVKLLRVLDLERFDFGEKLSKAIGNLVYLRYLSVRGSHFNKLPSSVGNLKYLQTLDLRVPFLVCLTVPNVIYKLKQLKHLYLPPSHRCSSSKLQLSGLRKLETLKNLDTTVTDYGDIPKLTKLQKLGANLYLEIENLTEMISLQREHNQIRESSFRIRFDFQSEAELNLLGELLGLVHLHKLDLVGVISRLPEHRRFSQRLTKLTLRGSRLKEDPMATLGVLPNLYSLVMRKNAFEGNQICCSRQGFPKLRILEFQGLINLECWRIENEAMPNLYCLKIDECVRLKMLPEGIQFIATLRELAIINMPDLFKSRVQKIQGEEGEDFYKVEHIRSITITETNKKILEPQLSGNSLSGLFQNISPVLIPKEWQKT